MNRFAASATPIANLIVVERLLLGDDRGSLTRLFCSEELGPQGWQGCPEQINLTTTRHAGTVRGLHFQQPPHAEIKLVSCLRGEIWDVAVDLRRGSATFGAWHAERLSADNRRALLIPRGFAHGFQSLTGDVELLYCHSEKYQPAAESGINPTDSALSIDWPLPITLMSERDRKLPMLAADFPGLTI